ncbi:MAG: hypothetical protein IPJ07_20450 [Acidobacteria bacterium]|nr:hypothetical protein [Acidobacteriota bacterium]
MSLEVGAPSESVIVQGGAEVLQTQSAAISTTITGRQITEIPSPRAMRWIWDSAASRCEHAGPSHFHHQRASKGRA